MACGWLEFGRETLTDPHMLILILQVHGKLFIILEFFQFVFAFAWLLLISIWLNLSAKW